MHNSRAFMEASSMSNEMWEDLATSNPFKKLSDDTILHICSSLPGADLLRISTVDKNFMRIITESPETMSKTRLVFHFNKNYDLDIDDAIKLAKIRRFTALRLDWISNYTLNNNKVKLISLLEVLRDSVDDLIVFGHRYPEQLLYTIIAMLLPRLKKCKLQFVSSTSHTTPIIEKISLRSNINHPLESLELYATHASKVLPLFVGCKQLKTFNYQFFDGNDTTKDIEHLNNFLAKQERLEKLASSARGIDWERLICFQLKELTVDCWSYSDHLALTQFLKKLPNLAKLNINVGNQPSRSLMDTIIRLPNLKILMIRARRDEDDYGNLLEGLKNHTVKELNIVDGNNTMSKLLTIFLGADSIYLAVRFNVLDLSDVPPTTIMKIKPNVDYCCEGFAVKFSPSELPTNVEEFQSSVMKFASEFSKLITGIVIGNKTWRSHGGDFTLSNSFCEGLVNILPNLVTLEVFNIANRGKFIEFLSENKGRLGLEDVQLHQSFGAGQTKPKKMKIQID